MTADPNDRRRRDAATFTALAGLLLCGLGLLGLAALVIPDILFLLLVAAGLFVIGLLQYVTWGWMLYRYRIRDDQDTP